MNPSTLIVLRIEIPAQAVPQWEQLPQECRKELIDVLVAILIHLPQVQALEERMREAPQASHRRLAIMARATFYLLRQGGLRLAEVDDLLLEDIDFSGRRPSASIYRCAVLPTRRIC